MPFNNVVIWVFKLILHSDVIETPSNDFIGNKLGVRLKKNTLKYLIDVTIFIDMCSVTVIGLLMEFIIPKE